LIDLPSKKKQKEIINVTSEDEAKQVVKNFKMKSYNSRDILKMKIMINGEKFPLNIPKIEEICKLKQNSKRKTELIDADFIKLYQQGLTPNDAVRILKCTFDEADKAFVKFQKYSGLTLVSVDDLDTLYSHLYKINPFVEHLETAIEAVKTTVDSHMILEKYRYRCSVCGGPLRLGFGEVPAVLQYLEKEKFGHDDCFKKL